MAATPRFANGTLFQRETSPGSGTWTTVAGVVNISGLNMGREMLDAGDMETGADPTFIPGMKQTKQVQVQMNRDISNATHTQLQTDADGGTIRLYRVLEPTTSKGASFNAYITDLEAEWPRTEKMTYDLTVQVTGAVTAF